mgnify:CR=1 FL=1|jgi:hypothetical protein
MPMIEISITKNEGIAIELLSMITGVPEDILTTVMLLDTQLWVRGLDFNAHGFIETIRVQLQENSK